MLVIDSLSDGLPVLLDYSPIQLGLPKSTFGNPHMGNTPYLIVPPYTLEYQDPGPEILRS